MALFLKKQCIRGLPGPWLGYLPGAMGLQTGSIQFQLSQCQEAVHREGGAWGWWGERGAEEHWM